MPLALVVVGGALRFAGLDTPRRTYFDEVYYAKDARSMLHHGVEVERPAHPPVGKWLTAAGIAVAGYKPLGWRLASAAAGTLAVFVTYLAASRLFARRWPAALAALLVAVDGLALTMSRIAMLDVFVGLFVVTGFWLVLIALDRRAEAWRWLALAGVSFGLAVATKWSGVLALVAALILVVAWELARARRHRMGRSELARRAGVGALCLLVLPAGVYVVSYAGWFVNYAASDAGRDRCPEGGCEVGVLERGRVWWQEQLELVDYHARLPTTHPYRSSPATWPLMTRPVLYYFEWCTRERLAAGQRCVVEVGNRAKILGLGNPAVWWVALIAYPVVAWLALVRRRRHAAVLAVFLLVQYLPWLAAGKDGYLFYATPLVPFIAMAVAALCVTTTRWRAVRWFPATTAALAVVSFVYFAPIWYGMEVPKPVLDERLWLGSWR
ncbi:MAG: phospholipid carrier-dependent glycosyltransferase [Actinomycetota bacterium]|nr:phospholipid carrier-dependent glycosyltransferase [Actinomycetota bacterium]